MGGMMTLSSVDDLFQSRFAETLGWTLFHSLWQLAGIAALSALILATLRRAQPNLRYLAACAGFLLMLAAPVATYFYLLPPAPPASMRIDAPPAAETPRITAEMITATPTARMERESPDSPPVKIQLPWSIRARQILRPWLPWAEAAYLLGTMLLLARLAAGYGKLRTLAKSGNLITGATRERLDALARRMRITRSIRLLQSAAVEVPTLLGAFKPVILLPAAAIAGLSPVQLEALLAHELAHIRRHDYLANLLQSFIEALLFYHPAAWWLSARIRQERENCCDDAAIAVTQNRIEYARALAAMESLRVLPEFALSARGGTLLDRVRRILGVPAHPKPESRRLLTTTAAALAIIVISTLVYVGCKTSSPAENPANISFSAGDGRIQIQARVLMVPTKTLNDASINWKSTLPAEALSATGIPSPGTKSPAHFRASEMNASALAEFTAAVERDKETQTVARPRVLLTNGQPARVAITQQQNYVKGFKHTPPPPGSTQQGSELFVETLTTGLTFDLKASLTADGKTISAHMHPEYSTLDGMDTFTEGAPPTVPPERKLEGAFAQVPHVTMIGFDAKASIVSGGALVIAGPKRTFEKETVTKVPVLSEAPLIGGWFTNHAYTAQEYTMVVIVQPEILPPTAATTPGTENQINFTTRYLLVSNNFMDDFRIGWDKQDIPNVRVQPGNADAQKNAGFAIVDDWTIGLLLKMTQADARTISVALPRVALEKSQPAMIGAGATLDPGKSVTATAPAKPLPADIAAMRIRFTPKLSADESRVELHNVSLGADGIPSLAARAEISVPPGGYVLIDGGTIKVDDVEEKPSRHLLILIKPQAGTAADNDPFHLKFDRTIPVPPAATANAPTATVTTPPAKAATLVAEAQKLYNAEKYRETADLLRQAVIIDPQNRDAKLLLRLAVMEAERNDPAIVLRNRYLEIFYRLNEKEDCDKILLTQAATIKDDNNLTPGERDKRNAVVLKQAARESIDLYKKLEDAAMEVMLRHKPDYKLPADLPKLPKDPANWEELKPTIYARMVIPLDDAMATEVITILNERYAREKPRSTDSNLKPAPSQQTQPATAAQMKAAALIADAHKLYQAEKYKEAADLLQQAVTIDPQNTEARFFLVITQTKITDQLAARIPNLTPAEMEHLIPYADLMAGGSGAWPEIQRKTAATATATREHIPATVPTTSSASPATTPAPIPSSATTPQTTIPKDDPQAQIRKAKVNSLIAEAQLLAQAEKLREAADLLRQAVIIDPENEAARDALRQVLIKITDPSTTMRLAPLQKIPASDFNDPVPATTRQLTGQEIMRQNINAAELIPYADLMIYPDNWPELTRNRGTVAPGGDWPANRAALDRLDENLREIAADAQSLEKVLNFLRDNMGANIYVDWKILQAAGIDKNTLVTISLKDIPFRKALTSILAQVGGERAKLAYAIDGGIIVISTRDDLQSPKYQVVKVFDLQEFFKWLDKKASPEEQAKARTKIIDDLIADIKSKIDKESWRDNGGAVGSIRELNGQLIINQTVENQIAIARLIQQRHIENDLFGAGYDRPATAPATQRLDAIDNANK